MAMPTAQITAPNPEMRTTGNDLRKPKRAGKLLRIWGLQSDLRISLKNQMKLRSLGRNEEQEQFTEKGGEKSK